MSDDLINRLRDAANPAQNGGGGGSWEQHKTLLTDAADTIARLEAALREAYALGFQASGEAYNGEYPSVDFRNDPVWQKDRDRDLAALSPREGEG